MTNYICKIPPLEILRKTVNSYPQSGIKLKKKENVKVTQSCLTLCDPMDYSLPGSSVRDSPGKNTRV